MKTEILRIDTNNPGTLRLKRAVEILKDGGVVVIPTDTVYGLAVNAFSTEGRRKIYELKGRSYKKPLIVMPPCIKALECLAEVTKESRRLMSKFWPGPLTLILQTRELGKMVMGGRADLGARIPKNATLNSLLSLCDFPLLTTSANPSSKPNAKTGDDAIKYFNGSVDMIIDAGISDLGKESTVLDVVKFPYIVIREGCLPKKKLIPYI